ncbi:MAG: antirestriction protein ArdA [Clostridia bacterium]|nr:antirestriction protein ArdA [Clostridia bacterium]
MIKIYLTNLGKYNEGYLVGKWVELPATDEELEAAKKEIGINQFYEEWFITDYESDIEGLEVNEYASISELNELAEELEQLDEFYLQIVGGLLMNGQSLREAIDNIDNCYIYFDCSDMSDVARAYVEETGMFEGVPENITDYFDYAALGRDLSFTATYIFLSCGNCIEICL